MNISEKAICQLARVQTLMHLTASNMEYAVKWNYITEEEVAKEIGTYKECMEAIDKFFKEADSEKTN